MEYEKSSSIKGKWVVGSDVVSGSKAKLTIETAPTPSQFKNKDGSVKIQDVSKILFDGSNEALNININRVSLDALISAFGKDSKKWVNIPFTVQTEKVLVGGKRQTAVYLIPDGFELKEDASGYMLITKIGEEDLPTISPDDIDPKDLPF